jgi:hypothetical protein
LRRTVFVAPKIRAIRQIFLDPTQIEAHHTRRAFAVPSAAANHYWRTPQ